MSPREFSKNLLHFGRLSHVELFPFEQGALHRHVAFSVRQARGLYKRQADQHVFSGSPASLQWNVSLTIVDRQNHIFFFRQQPTRKKAMDFTQRKKGRQVPIIHTRKESRQVLIIELHWRFSFLFLGQTSLPPEISITFVSRIYWTVKLRKLEIRTFTFTFEIRSTSGTSVF